MSLRHGERTGFNSLPNITAYHQMVGHYYGKIKISEENTLHIDSLLGCIEDHFAKW
ncbi:hypothetical protein ACDX78_05785 [Virgibacillus oceani]